MAVEHTVRVFLKGYALITAHKVFVMFKHST